MNTFPIVNETGEKRAFEIENVYVSIRDICKILQDGSGISDIMKRNLFQSPSDVHVHFKCDGKAFIVWEPYGDSSRYWIGEDQSCSDAKILDKVENLFKSYTPPLHRRIIGDILTLKFLFYLFRGKNKTL